MEAIELYKAHVSALPLGAAELWLVPRGVRELAERLGALLPHSWHVQHRERHVYPALEAALSRVEPWTPRTAWGKCRAFSAASYEAQIAAGNLFPGVVPWDRFTQCVERGGDLKTVLRAEQREFSPSGRWVYLNSVLPAGIPLYWCRGADHGAVMFDGPVTVPTICERDPRARDAGQGQYDTWMSLTPNEIMTLRPGTQLARGHTIIAGLGLGHQLIEVAKRRSVTKITLVERDSELLDWLWPKIEPKLGGKPCEVIEGGDAYDVLPDLEGDVALIDIFKCYGNNDQETAWFREHCPRIKRVWGWGAVRVSS